MNQKLYFIINLQISISRLVLEKNVHFSRKLETLVKIQDNGPQIKYNTMIRKDRNYIRVGYFMQIYK